MPRASKKERDGGQVTKSQRSALFSVEAFLHDPEVKSAFDALEDEFNLIRQLIDLRQKRGLTQRELGKRAGTLGADVKLQLVPRAKVAKRTTTRSNDPHQPKTKGGRTRKKS